MALVALKALGGGRFIVKDSELARFQEMMPSGAERRSQHVPVRDLFICNLKLSLQEGDPSLHPLRHVTVPLAAPIQGIPPIWPRIILSILIIVPP